MTIDELIRLHNELTDQARTLMEKKNHDYTNGSVDPFANFRGSSYLNVPPEKGLLIRVQDKMMRISTFIDKRTLKVDNESCTDAIIDVINYMVLLAGLIEDNRPEQEKVDKFIKEQVIPNFKDDYERLRNAAPGSAVEVSEEFMKEVQHPSRFNSNWRKND